MTIATRKNPHVGDHPDLFGGKTARFVPLEDLTRDQIAKLPRDAFDESEWAEVADVYGEELQHHIYDHDDVSTDRRRGLRDALRDAVDHIVAMDHDRALQDGESWIEQYLSEPQDLLEQAKRGVEVDSLRDEFPHVEEEEFEENLKELLTDHNLWSFELESYSQYARVEPGALYIPVFQNVYIDFEPYFDGNHKQIGLDEVEYLLDEEMDGEEVADFFDASNIFKGLQGRYPEYSQELSEPYGALRGTFDWNAARDDMKEMHGDEPEDPEWAAAPPEERVVHRFDDGFYVLNMTPAEMKVEGKVLRHCIKDESMGYLDSVRGGEAQAWSLRTAAGRPKLTIFVEGPPFNEINQVHGKSNRLPGWDLGKEGEGTMKEFEVRKLLELFEAKGIRDLMSIQTMKPALNEIGSHPDKYPESSKLVTKILDKEFRSFPRKNPKPRPVCTDCKRPVGDAYYRRREGDLCEPCYRARFKDNPARGFDLPFVSRRKR